MRDTEIYREAIETYGYISQTLMCMEEMSELQKELCKNARGKDNKAAIAEEIADVRIMLDQMEILHECHLLTAKYKRQKIKRLEKNLRG